MAFINEFIAQEDFTKYDLASINLKRGISSNAMDIWTVDRERDIYVRHIRGGREEFFHETDWTLYYEGQLFDFGISNISTEGQPNGIRKGHKALRYLHLPQAWESRRDEVISVLKEGLTAWKDGGVYATATEYTLTLDI